MKIQRMFFLFMAFLVIFAGFFAPCSYADWDSYPENEDLRVDFSAPVTDPYGYSSWRGSGWHNGVDFGADYGTMIPSLTSGTVYTSQTGYGINPGGYGNMIAIVSDDGDTSFVYGHVQRIYVVDGEHVEMGQPLGEVGSEGHSTGPHLHISVFEGGPPYEGGQITDPTDLINSCPFFHVNGDISNNTLGSGIAGAARKLIPHLDMDFSKYFEPSQEAEAMAKEILSKITLAFDFGNKYLFPLLVLLAIIDFVWFMIGLMLGLRNDKGMGGIVVRILRYSIFFFLFQSWHWMIDNFCIPFVENISSTYSGHAITETSFLHFDELFVSVTHVIGPFLHVDDRFTFVVGIIVAVLVVFILILTMIATFYMMYKLILFYLVCAFGVLGIPFMFVQKLKPYGKNMISVIFCSAFDLIVTAFLYVFISDQLSGMEALDADSVVSLLTFTFGWFLLVLFLPKFSDSALQAFASLWD